MDNEQVNYTNWASGQPSSISDRDNCGVISISLGVWYLASNCFIKQPYICEAPINTNILPNPSNVLTYGGNSNGRACIFPFIYNSKAYYECTRDGRDNFWCATTDNYDRDMKWGYCSCMYRF